MGILIFGVGLLAYIYFFAALECIALTAFVLAIAVFLVLFRFLDIKKSHKYSFVVESKFADLFFKHD